MSRKDIYEKVKELKLQDKVKELYGDNYTRISNEELLAVINAVPQEDKVMFDYSDNHNLDKLIEILKKKHILLDSEIDYIYS